ncbi:MAG TPA: FAD-dependent oxidoreductase [Polyangiaceae bacterium]|nr:FAD-dependent oxidoreductase [Polyangiaceae bacterium]
MRVGRRQVLGAMASVGLTTGLGARQAFAHRGRARRGAIERDVCIVGGGAAGTFAALGLRDRGKSVVVVERADRLGGHCETFHDPASGAAIDIGVIVFPDNALVRGLFARYGVPLAPAAFAPATNQFVDFRTGQAVAAFQPSALEVGTALATYLQILEARFPFLDANGFQLPAPGPELDELLLPFGEWVSLYGLEALLPTFFLFEQGFGPLLDATTLYVLKNMNRAVVGSVLANSFLFAPLGAGALYEGAESELGSDVLYESEVCDVERGSGICLRVRTPEGERRIRAQSLLFTAPPVLDNLSTFDLDRRERALFARFRRHHYWTAVAAIGGMPIGVSLVNAAPDTPFNLGPLPGIYSIGPNAAPGLFDIKFGSDRFLSDRRVRRRIQQDIERVATRSAHDLDFQGFTIFKNHSPYSVVTTPQQIRDGFYASLQALQGYRDTFYAGAAFQTHSSAAVWAQVEELLPSIAG